MIDLQLAKTKHTPDVTCNSATGEITLAGSSYPENTFDFYDPLMKWISQYMLEVTGKITLNFRLDYMNSSSIKFVSDIITKLTKYNQSGGSVEINWFYADDDDDIREMGEELKEDTDIPFNIIEA